MYSTNVVSSLKKIHFVYTFKNDSLLKIAVIFIVFLCPLQKTHDNGAMRSLPRMACRNSSTCCIPAQPDSPSLWTDCEKVRMFLTTLLDTGSVTLMETCHQQKLKKITCLFQTWWYWLILLVFLCPRRVFHAVASHYYTSEILWFLDELMLAVLQDSYPIPPPPPSRSSPSRCCESLWCQRAVLIPFCAPLTDRMHFVALGPSPLCPSQVYF